MTEAITFTGLGSGLDLKSIVDAMVETEKLRYIKPMEDWRSHWEEMSSAFSTLGTKLASFHSTVKSMDSAAEFLVNTASSSDTDVATATAASGAVEGSYEIEVNQLAQADKQIHSGAADPDAPLSTTGDKVFSYTYNGTTREITITDNETSLTDLKTYINSDPSNPGITASILDDGQGSYHLILTGKSTGSDFGISINTVASSLSGYLAADFDNSSQAAQDAKIKIDGYPPGSGANDYIIRSTNSIGDVIEDISLNLIASGTTTISSSTDATAIKENIITLVKEFNEIREHIKEVTAYDANTDQAGILLGNYGADIVKNRLNEIMASNGTGFRDGYDTQINLMQLGISTDVDEGSETQGQLVIDEATLDAALTEDPLAVADLFTSYYSGRSAHDDIVYESHIPGITEPGTYEIYFNHTDPTAEGNVQMRIKGGEWHNATWEASTKTITGAEGYPESGLVVKITNTSQTISKTNPGEVDIKLGILGTLKEELDLMTNPKSGTMSVLVDNYQGIIDTIDKKIDREESRIELYQTRLEERYARLEGILTEMNGQSTMLEKQIQQLESNT